MADRYDPTAFVLPGPFVRLVHQRAKEMGTSATVALLYMLCTDQGDGIDIECLELAQSTEDAEAKKWVDCPKCNGWAEDITDRPCTGCSGTGEVAA